MKPTPLSEYDNSEIEIYPESDWRFLKTSILIMLNQYLNMYWYRKKIVRYIDKLERELNTNNFYK